MQSNGMKIYYRGSLGAQVLQHYFSIALCHELNYYVEEVYHSIADLPAEHSKECYVQGIFGITREIKPVMEIHKTPFWHIYAFELILKWRHKLKMPVISSSRRPGLNILHCRLGDRQIVSNETYERFYNSWDIMVDGKLEAIGDVTDKLRIPVQKKTPYDDWMSVLESTHTIGSLSGFTLSTLFVPEYNHKVSFFSERMSDGPHKMSHNEFEHVRQLQQLMPGRIEWIDA